jgi:hypothetical protein
MPKRIDAEGQFDYAASAQLASQLTLRPPLTAFVQSAFQAWTIDRCILFLLKRATDVPAKAIE